MLKRIVTAVIATLLLIPFLIFSDTLALIVLTTILGTVASYELLKCTGMLNKLPVAALSFLLMLAAQILVRLLSTEKYLSIMLLIYMAYFVAVMTVSVFSKGKIVLSDSLQCAVMTAYVSFGFATLVLLRDMNENYGIVLFLLALLIPWVCDSSAYFVGVFFGKHKLIPDVSPKKTVEGAIGGIFGGVLITAIFGMIMHFGYGKMPNYILLLSLAFVGCAVSQWGDLIASLLKREYGVKDYGWIFPGHGGVMDRFDSLFAVSIFIYIVCRTFASYPLFINW